VFLAEQENRRFPFHIPGKFPCEVGLLVLFSEAPERESKKITLNDKYKK
jgi:hypothetical protein